MRNDRENQDKYDVIQAREEWESMHIPRHAQDKIDYLTRKLKVLEDENTRLRADIKELERWGE